MDLQSIRDLVASIATKNMIGAGDVFNDIMGDKLTAALDARRQEVAAAVYGSQETDAETDVPSAENGSVEAE